MIDIKLLRENPELVKENIRKKFQDQKLVLVDEVIELDKKSRELTLICDELRMKRNSISKEIGNLMSQGKKDEAESKKKEVNDSSKEIESPNEEEKQKEGKVKEN